MRVNANAVIVRDEKVLLIRFEDGNGIHFNFPGGGVDEGESVIEALARECREEACAEVTVGEVLGVWEYVPEKAAFKYGKVQKVGLIFRCDLAPGCEPCLPEKPDPNQVGVEWVSLDYLTAAPSPRRHPVLPEIAPQILAAALRGERGFFVGDA